MEGNPQQPQSRRNLTLIVIFSLAATVSLASAWHGPSFNYLGAVGVVRLRFEVR